MGRSHTSTVQLFVCVFVCQLMYVSADPDGNFLRTCQSLQKFSGESGTFQRFILAFGATIAAFLNWTLPTLPTEIALMWEAVGPQQGQNGEPLNAAGLTQSNWNRVNHLLYIGLLNILTPNSLPASLISTTQYQGKGFKSIGFLMEKYQGVSETQRTSVLNQFLLLKMDEGDDVDKWISELQSLFDMYNMCGTEKLPPQMLLDQIFRGVPLSLQHIVIELKRNAVTDIVTIAVQLREYQKMLALKSGQSIHQIAPEKDNSSDKKDKIIKRLQKKLNKKIKKKKGKKAKNDYHCDICDKDGHTSSYCWFNPDGNRHRKCTVCGEDGHLARSCKKNVQKEKPVKQVAASDEIQYSDSDSEPEEDH